MSDTLIVSVSGIRGIVGKDLTPELVHRFAAAMGTLVGEAGGNRVVLARDSRTSGPMFAEAAAAGLEAAGCGVIDCGMIPTPTAQLAVEHHGAGGGIIVTASHNPIEWNALKFVGADGVFLDAEAGARLRGLAEGDGAALAGGGLAVAGETDGGAVARHLDGVLGLSVIDVERIRSHRFTVALDCARGVGGTIMPALLEALGCRVVGMELETDGHFTRPPEPGGRERPAHWRRLHFGVGGPGGAGTDAGARGCEPFDIAYCRRRGAGIRGQPRAGARGRGQCGPGDAHPRRHRGWGGKRRGHETAGSCCPSCTSAVTRRWRRL
jgi:phosphomannomutase